MSIIREKFIKIIETLPYDLQEEIYRKKTFDILKDVTQRYVDTYGIDDLSKGDKEVIYNVLGNDFHNIENKENRRESE